MWDINADAACSLYSVKRKRKRIGSRSWSMERERKVWTQEIKKTNKRWDFALQVHRLCKYWSYIL